MQKYYNRMTKIELNEALCKFMLEMRKKDILLIRYIIFAVVLCDICGNKVNLKSTSSVTAPSVN